MKVFVIFYCDNCGAEGEGFRDQDEIETEECWRCGECTYNPTTADEDGKAL